MNQLPKLSDQDRHQVQQFGQQLHRIREELSKKIIGQEAVIEELLIALLAQGHCLLVGVPGLAKTLLISTMADLISLNFKRIQFTPDLMPNDITGATVIGQGSEPGSRELRFLKGPIFCHLLLADEINRTPPKTQAALMEAMEERQVTAGGKTHKLEPPFFVLATQNPIEQEGTYPLPVTQLDRFLLEVHVDYPDFDEEFQVVELTTSGYESQIQAQMDRDAMLQAIQLVKRIPISSSLIDYTTRIIRSTRPSEAEESSSQSLIQEWINWGAGPRAIQSILQGSQARALLQGREEVSVEDIHRVVFPALRHRMQLNYHAEAEEIQPDHIIEKILLGMPDQLYQAPSSEESDTQKSRWGFLKAIFGN